MYNALLLIDPNLSGNLFLKEDENIVTVYGKISSSKTEEIKKFILIYLEEKYPNKLYSVNIDFNKFIVFEDKLVEGDTVQNKVELDEVKILFNGMLSLDLIKENTTHKKINPVNMERINNAVRVMNFIAPIVLNKNLEIIDGQVRLQLAKDNEIKEVPVIILDTTYIQENTLRLALNRSSEFQRWEWVDIDNFIDNNPQVQPILEPLGLFGRYVLPESYFTETVVQYKIDPFNKKQMAYNQEWGLAKWAEIRRKQIQEALDLKYAPKKRKEKPTVSLFDLVPTEEDFLETYDADEELAKFNEKWKNIATEISAKKDVWSKERKEALGQEWQIKVRSNKDFADDQKDEFVNKIIDSDLFTEDELETIFKVENLVKFKNLKPNEIRNKLDELNMEE